MTWENYHLVAQRSNNVIWGGNFRKFSELGGGGTNAIRNHTVNIIEGGYFNYFFLPLPGGGVFFNPCRGLFFYPCRGLFFYPCRGLFFYPCRALFFYPCRGLFFYPCGGFSFTPAGGFSFTPAGGFFFSKKCLMPRASL